MAAAVPSDDHHPVVGRAHEFARLSQLLDAAHTGSGRLVLVSGEAGIGKTTLIEDVVRQATERDMVVLSGGCYDLITTPPYGPWIEILRAHPSAPNLPSIAGTLLDSGGLEQIASQEQLFRIVADFLTEIMTETPVLLLLEDLHWSDVASIDLLRFLARQLSEQRILILASYRNDELLRSHPLFTTLPLLVREARAERLELQPFDDEQLRTFVERKYSLAHSDTHRLVSFLSHHTEGNPLFVVELLRAIEHERVLLEREGIWRLEEDLEQIGPPPLVVQIIERQLTTLDPETRSVLEMAAIIGQEISLDLWQEVAGLDGDSLAAIIEQALVARVIEQYGGSRLRIRHALIRDVLYHAILYPKRRLLHRKTAEVLVESGSTDLDRVAYHFQQAGDERSIEWLIRAGDRAARAWATFTAMERYEAALHLLGDDKATLRERGWLLLALGQTGRDVAARRALVYVEESQQIARQIGDDALAAWAMFSLGENRIFLGQNGLPEMEQGLAKIRRLPPTSPPELPSRFRNRHRRAVETDVMDADIIVMQALFGRYREALANAEDYLARDRCDDDFHLMLRGHAEVARAAALSVLGDPEGSTLAYRSAHDAYQRAKGVWHRALIATSELESVTLAYQADHIAERRRIAAQIEALWTQVDGIATTELPPRFGLLPLLVIEGEWNEAWELALPFADRGVSFYFFALHALGVIARFRGEPDIAWNQVYAALPDGSGTEPGSVWMPSSMELQRLAANLALDAGDTDLALQWIEAHDRWLAWSERIQGRAEGKLLWTRYLQVVGDLETARQHARQALEFASNPRQPLALIAASRSRGELDTERGRYRDAEQHLRRALDWADACNAPYEQAITLLALADLGVTTDEPDTAWQHLDQARALCIPLGAAPALRHAASIAGRLAVRRGNQVHPAGLTPREVEVLQLVADGLTDAEVAARLSLSPRTINSHLTSIYNKLGVNSRVEAVRFAFEQGLTDSRTP